VYSTEVFTPEEDSLILHNRNVEILNYSLNKSYIYLPNLNFTRRAENSDY